MNKSIKWPIHAFVRVFVAASWYEPLKHRPLYSKLRELVIGDRAEKMAQEELDNFELKQRDNNDDNY